MVLDITFLIASLLLILGCCVVFVNAVEQLGDSFNLHQGIVGSILAAVGTALPETIIPIIAIFFAKGGNGHEIGIGAIAGAPFMLGTLAFFITGAAVIVFSLLGKRKLVMTPDPVCLSRDLTFFLVFYSVAVSTTFFHEMILVKAIVAIGLLLSYGIYLKWTVSHECDAVDNVEPLYFTRFFRLPQNRFWIICQVVFSLCLLVVGAHFFISYVQALSLAFGVSPLILSLLITPIATEMPEKLNSIIWIGKKKDTLALGNITGAMVFQSCFPVVFGMLFTQWDLRGVTLVSAGLALASALTVLLWIRIKKTINPFILLAGGAFYACLFVFLVLKPA
jgi:cation:H+ antiporter